MTTQTLYLSSLSNSQGFNTTNSQYESLTGSTVSNAGDVNGDGYDDILVGAKSAKYNGNQGLIYLIWGNKHMNSSINLNSPDSSVTYIYSQGATEVYLGAYLSGLGDINNDGFDDIIFTSYTNTYVLFGANDLPYTINALEISNTIPGISLLKQAFLPL